MDNSSIDTLLSPEWKLNEQFARVLQPFQEVSPGISSDDACTSVVVPLIDVAH
jgi:hypothetical protein